MLIESGHERLVIGKLIADPVVTQFGEKQHTKAKFRVSYGEGKKDVMDIEAVFEVGDRCKNLKKFDGVVVLGKMDSWTDKEGNKRWFLKAELITADLGVIRRAYGKTVNEAPQIGFTEIADNDLPFD